MPFANDAAANIVAGTPLPLVQHKIEYNTDEMHVECVIIFIKHRMPPNIQKKKKHPEANWSVMNGVSSYAWGNVVERTAAEAATTYDMSLIICMHTCTLYTEQT